MEAWRDRFDPVGWKVYTLGKLVDGDWVSTWRLDDDDGHGSSTRRSDSA